MVTHSVQVWLRTLIAAFLIIVTAGCNSARDQSESITPVTIEPSWVDPEIAADGTVTISLSDVQKLRNVHFTLYGTHDGELQFMAYILDGRLYVRANACPPCRTGFNLIGDSLDCRSCTSYFDAKTGRGILWGGVFGGCVIFPKTPIPHIIKDGRIVMKYGELMAANRENLKSRTREEAMDWNPPPTLVPLPYLP
ncbi:MAG: hypothetical protein Q7O66_17275 [Dehalococcoidia bacterium]|nr:hypothetical protein [Dehalococcoidia bacterium]